MNIKATNCSEAEFLVRVQIGSIDGECQVRAADAEAAQLIAEAALPARFRLKHKAWSVEVLK